MLLLRLFYGLVGSGAFFVRRANDPSQGGASAGSWGELLGSLVESADTSFR
jgi:hypothetical protein